MFTIDATIDTVQNSKKQVINTFVQNEAIKEVLIDLVDAQTSYTKEAAKVNQEAFTKLVSESVKLMQESGKFDYSKFGEGAMRAYQNMTK
jgi:hypothetical protein